MKPYTYLIKHIPSNRCYYGVRFADGCDPSDLWKTYFTSSKRVKGLIRRYGKKSFSYEVRKTFDTPKQARVWEEKVLTRINAVKRKDFLNLGNSGDQFYLEKHSKESKRKMSEANKGKNHPNYGKKRSKEIKIKISESLKGKNHFMYGKNHLKNTKIKVSKAMKGENNHFYGKKHSKETLLKMKKAKKLYWQKRKQEQLNQIHG
jgi:group I intron endonuclease